MQTGEAASSEVLAIAMATAHLIYSRVADASGVPDLRCCANECPSMPLDVPADTTLSSREFFRTEGAYTSSGTPIPGRQVDRWILREGPHFDSDVGILEAMCWRLVGDGLPLFRATLQSSWDVSSQIRAFACVRCAR